MKCPACGSEMAEHDFGSAHVGVCEDGCYGIWFDWRDLARLDERDEGFGAALRRALGQPQHVTQRRLQLVCPRCGTPMREYKHGPWELVDIDECYTCGGFFLDPGELGTLRDIYMPREEKREYADRLAQEVPQFSARLGQADQEHRDPHAGAGHVRHSAVEHLLWILRLI